MPKTLFDKIWEAHEVSHSLLYIDLHLVHEVTSPQAFDGLRLAGRKVRRPDRTLATVDHNVPTDGTARRRADPRRALARAGRDARAQLRGVRDPALLARLRAPGDRARDRPRARGHAAGDDDRVRRLAHGDARSVRGARVRDRHERGRARARHAVPRPVEAALDADLLRRRARLRRDRQGPDPRHDRPDRRRRAPSATWSSTPGTAIAVALDGGSDDGLQHDDRGRRARGHDRPGRDHVRVGHRAAGSAVGGARRLA